MSKTKPFSTAELKDHFHKTFNAVMGQEIKWTMEGRQPIDQDRLATFYAIFLHGYYGYLMRASRVGETIMAEKWGK